MRLKKLKLSGFKSFAEEVFLNFDEEIIAIVGPNGCGKSNIVDAFRWIMGEQGAKSMRADKMHDVIFAGTDKRKAYNCAEVALTLEIEEEEEVTLTRRLHRSGESEYLINKEPVRLKDIQHLFLDSGVGRNAFAIFEQGKLDQIIYLTPFERRAFFDESAGIARFILKKKECLKRLEEVTLNHEKIKEIHSEVDRKRRSLKKQAEAVKTFQETKEKLRAVEKSLLFSKLELSEQKSRTLKESHDLLSCEVKQLKESQFSLEEYLSTKRGEWKALEKELKAQEISKYQLESNLKIKTAEGKRLQEQIEELKERKNKFFSEHHEREQKKSELQLELDKKLQRQTELATEKQLLQHTLLQAQKDHQEIVSHLNKLQAEEKSFRKKELATFEEFNAKTSEFKEKKFRFEANKEKRATLSQEITHNQTKLFDLKKEEEKKRKELEKLNGAIEEEKKELELHLAALAEKSNELKGVENKQGRIASKLSEHVAHRKALLNLKEDFEGFSSGGKVLLKESKNSKSPLFKKVRPLYEFFMPEKAMWSAFFHYSATLVVETRADLRIVLEFAKSTNLTDFSLFCLEGLKEEALSTHFTKDLHSKAGFEELVNGGEKSLVFEGFFVDHKGVFFRYSEAMKESHIFSREQKLKEIENELKTLEKESELLQKKVLEKSEEKQVLELARHSREEKKRKIEMTQLQQNFFLQQLAKEIKELSSDSLSLQKQLDTLEKNLEQESKALELFHEQLAILAAKKEESISHTKHLEKEIKEKQECEKERFRKKKKIEQALSSPLAEYEKLSNEILLLRANLQSLLEQEKKQLSELTTLTNKLSSSEEGLKKIEDALIEEQSHLEDLFSSHKKLSETFSKIKEELEKGEAHHVKEKKQLELLLSKEEALKLSFQEEVEKIKSLEEEMRRVFGTLILENEALFKTKSLVELQEEIIRLRYELEKTQDLNLTAVDEFNEEEKKFLEIDHQLNDLKRAKEDLETIISTLESECRKVFKVTFDHIRRNFQKNFALFFNGGKADLKLTESSDILAAGVEIIAEPPGKQMRSISLLSGGEKCMTALALLFSLFEQKPAPFCVLDEVDAPLDEANIARFTNVLKQFVPRTQFILVTHNKKTMAMADSLFGITMEEKGISKLISLIFEKEQGLLTS